MVDEYGRMHPTQVTCAGGTILFLAFEDTPFLSSDLHQLAQVWGNPWYVESF